MKIEDSFTVSAPIESVWNTIIDPDQIAPCIPGCEGVEIVGPNSYRSKIRVGLGPINTTFKVDVQLTEQRPPHYLASLSRGEEGGRLSSISAQNELILADEGQGITRVSYSAEVQIVGRLGKFGLGIMKKKAKALGEEFARALREKIENA
jgi:hypothetical protein